MMQWVRLVLIAVGGLALQPAGAQSFGDMQGHWAQAAVKNLAHAGVVTGFPSGEFRPDAKVTRAEAAIMVLKALNKGPRDTTEGATPEGSRPGAWAQPYLERATEQGLFDAIPDPSEAGRPATRTEVATMAVRGLERSGATLPPAPSTPQFRDVPEGAAARREIGLAAAGDLIKGYPDGTFRPAEPVTRAEAATLVARLRTAADEAASAPGAAGTVATPNVASPPGSPSMGATTNPTMTPSGPTATEPVPTPPTDATTDARGTRAGDGTAVAPWNWETLWARYAPWLVMGLLLLAALIYLAAKRRQGSLIAGAPRRRA